VGRVQVRRITSGVPSSRYPDEERLELSRAQFGSHLGATAATIASWEQARTLPELGRLRRVSIALGWGDPLHWPTSEPPWKIIAAHARANDGADTTGRSKESITGVG
jgi:hypothetical protein